MNNKDDVFACVCGSGRSLGFVCASSLFQELIPHVLGITSDLSVYKENRELLGTIMEKHGFRRISSEWWHFDDVDFREYPLLDVDFIDLYE